MRTLISLFDYSGQWAKPFYDKGWEVIQWDIKLSEFMDINLLTDCEMVLDMFENVDGIIAGLPCTDFSSSGARWWTEKDANGSTAKSIELARQTLRLVDLFRPTDPDYDDGFFWTIENPVGRMASLIGLDDPYYFDPYEFAGYNNLSSEDLEKLDELRLRKGKGISKSEAEFIIECNCYTKKTGLWGEFNRNLKKKPIAPIKGNEYGSPHMRIGGKSDRTKEIRSNTPYGFALAFYEANKDYVLPDVDAIQLSLF